MEDLPSIKLLRPAVRVLLGDSRQFLLGAFKGDKAPAEGLKEAGGGGLPSEYSTTIPLGGFEWIPSMDKADRLQSVRKPLSSSDKE